LSLVTSSFYRIYSVYCAVIGEQLIVPYIFRVLWRHWWPAHCTVYIPCVVASLVTTSLYRIYSVCCGVIGDHLIVPYIFRVLWRHWWPAHCTVYIPCVVASLVTSSLYRIYSVWCGGICDQFIVLCIFPHRLIGDIYANVLRPKLPTLLKNVPLQTERRL